MSIDKKKDIESALQSFVLGDLTKNALHFFKTLGYITDRRAPLEKPTFAQFKESFISVDSHFNEEKAQVKLWKYVDLLFQLSGNELIKTTDMFDSKVVVTKDDGSKIAIESYLFFVVELEGKSFSRTQLSHITREINRLFPMPAMIIFKYDALLTLAVIDRRLHKRDASKDVLEKVTLIKDISIISPHRAHIEILFDLSFDELKNKSKEPIIHFIALHNSWRKTLNISELNKKFYRQIADWFYWAVSKVEFPLAPNITNERENASINVIRLLTRIIFVWFLKEKDLVPDDLFDEKKLAVLLNDTDLQSGKKWNYYRGILQNLFFATLNQKMNTVKEPNNREWVSEKRASSGYNEDYTIANKYRFPELFKNPDQALQLFSTIPFLNGGLFDCLDRRGNKQKGDIFIDGFTRHTKPQPKVPNMLFFGEKRKVDLSKVFEDKKWSKEEVKGLIHILNDYKFTIAENTPIEEEVALDPELLGRIFENLLAAYNPETGTTARKATGSFYTPREIVNYMVDESLLAYLKNVLLDEAAGAVLIGHEQVDAFGNDARKGQLKIEDKVERNPWKEKEAELENHLRGLLSYSEKPNPFNAIDTDTLISAIGRCKILDPACGSGAFPMGMLLKTVHVLHKLDPNNAKWQQVQENAARTIPDPEIQRDTLARIEEAFSPENNYADYGRKLVLIQNCIYGIDIQPVAVQISKLRFFISLLVDQKYNDTKENRGVLSLPNLETKFVAANTLIGIDESIQGSLHNADIQQLVGKLHDVRKQIFNARSYRNKKELQKQDEQHRKQLGALLEQKTLEAQKVLERQIETLQSQKTISEKKLKEKNLLAGVRKQTEEAIKKINKQVEELQTKLLDRHIVETNATRLSDWDPYDQNAHADFFDKEWMFGMQSGFDIVIGNPPYGAEINDGELLAIRKRLNTYRNSNSAVLFIDIAKHHCLRDDAILTYIVPKSLLFAENWSDVVEDILTSTTNIVDVETAFENVLLEQVVFVLVKDGNTRYYKAQKYYGDDFVREIEIEKHLSKKLGTWICDVSEKEIGIIKSIKCSIVHLSEISSTKRGLGIQGRLTDRGSVPVIGGKNISRYSLSDIKGYTTKETLKEYSKRLEYFNQPKIISQRIIAHVQKPKPHLIIMASLDETGTVLSVDTVENTIIKNDKYDMKFVLGIINCSFTSWYAYKFIFASAIRTMDFDNYYIGKIFIPDISNEEQKPLSLLVNRILASKENNPAADTSALEREIDLLVYNLYGLTEEEIKIVEGRNV